VVQFVDRIQAILRSGVLTPELVKVPCGPAKRTDIADTEQAVGRTLSKQHRDLLSVWDGIDLEVVRFLSAETGDSSIRLSATIEVPLFASGLVPIACDPDGFLYLEGSDGAIWQWDHDGGQTEVVANDIEDFVCSFVFGARAAKFGGEEWLEGLRAAGQAQDDA